MNTSFFSTYSVNPSISIFGVKSNHLGNVLNVITDRKLPINDATTNKVDYYTADVVAYNDYMPFGALMEGRHGYEGKKTRHGYQGSEMDDEVKGEGNSYTTEFRQLDPRLGRWLSIDPKANEMPWQSPYCSMDNNPIWNNDPLGDVAGKPTNYTVQKGDNLTAIAKKHGTTVKEIAAANGIEDPNVIKVGQVLKITPGLSESANSNKLSNDRFLSLLRRKPMFDPLTLESGRTADAGFLDPIFTLLQTGLEEIGVNENVASVIVAATPFFIGSVKFPSAIRYPRFGAAKGSLKSTKSALIEAKQRIGLKPNETLPKLKQGKFGSPQRGTPQKGYRLDPAHPNAVIGSGEEYPHINYWDYSTGKRGAGGIYGAIPILF